MPVKNTIWDPLRKKDVALTPEEKVRQWFIGVMAETMQVPMHMMMSEAGFKYGEKQYRADIIAYDRKLQPLVVVECKRPDVELTQEVLDQAIRYNMVLQVRLIVITNGLKTVICEKSDKGYRFLDNIPKYLDLI